MKEFFRQSMAWLHTWSGLVPGWVLYFIFLTGTLGYFDTEIDRWMKPELPPARYQQAAEQQSPEQMVAAAQQRLQDNAAGAERWFVALPRDRTTPYLRLFWAEPNGGRRGNDELIDPATGQPLETRATGGGQLLYRMHWNLHYLPRTLAHWLVGVATLGMFVALITGVVIHVKIFKDFFTFRPAKGQRSWLDAHNVLSVSALPFHVMITFTGLLFMASTYMPLIIAAQYGTSEESLERFRAEMFGDTRATPAAGLPAPLVDLPRLVAGSERQWGEASIQSLEVINPGDANARVLLHRVGEPGVLRSGDTAVFDGVTGELLETRPAQASTTQAVRDVLLGLHEGLFAGPLLRWLYVFSGLLGTAMIATGLVLWAVKRRQRGERDGSAGFGLRLVERINIGTVIGLPVALAAYFWANRLLPVGWAERSAWEVHVMFLTWGAMLLHAALRPTRRAWIEQLGIAALAYGLLPLLNGLTTDRGLPAALRLGDWLFVGFDLSMLVLGLAFLWGMRRVAGREAASATRQTAGRQRFAGEASS